VGFTSLLATIPVFYFGLILNTQVMLLIYNTHYQEAYQLFGGYLWQITIAIVLYIGVILLVVKTVPSRLSFSVAWKITCLSLILILGVSLFKFNLKSLPASLKSTAF